MQLRYFLTLLFIYWVVGGLYRIYRHVVRTPVNIPDPRDRALLKKIERAEISFSCVSIAVGLLGFVLLIRYAGNLEALSSWSQFNAYSGKHGLFNALIVVGGLGVAFANYDTIALLGSFSLMRRDLLREYELQGFRHKSDWVDQPLGSPFSKAKIELGLKALRFVFFLVIAFKCMFYSGVVGLLFLAIY